MTPEEIERQMMARIRGLSARASAADIRTELDSLQSCGRARLPSSDLVEALCQNLSLHGASHAVVSDRSEAVLAVSGYIAERYSQRRVVCGYDARLAAMPWRDGGVLPRFGSAESGDAVAISYASAAIAETGSLAIPLGRDNPAVNNLLPVDHIVLVNRRDIRAYLEDVWTLDACAPEQTRGVMLISGPSSTADIAMELVVGAHGPQALHVIVIAA